MLELLLEKRIREIRYPELQKGIAVTDNARGVRLDVYTEDEENTVYDIEMQTTEERDLPKRCRYYHGMIDLNLIERGARFRELKKCYVIFICKQNLGKRPVYSYQNRCDQEPALVLGDDAHTVLVNVCGDTRGLSSGMKSFLTYLRTGDIEEDSGEFIRRLHKMVLRAREHKEWRVEYMTLQQRYDELYDRAMEKGREEGKAEGKVEGKAESILSLLEECGEIPDELRERILSEKDEKILLVMLKRAAKAESVEQFAKSLDEK